MLRQFLRIATRRSPLALQQAEMVKALLERYHPQLRCRLVPLLSTGDKMISHPLAIAGGKGLFIKELEVALLEDQADIAVHSMKDMPVNCAEGLMLAAFLEREDPRDVWVSPHYATLEALPAQARVGTASLRRGAMIKFYRSDMQIKLVRGNLQTRLQKLMAGEYDALVLAAAGLLRLELSQHIQHYFSIEQSLPAIGQGIIGIECRKTDRIIKKLLTPINHYPTQQCLLAERALNRALGGNCHAPIAGYAVALSNTLQLEGWVLHKEGKKIIKTRAENLLTHPELLGEQVAQQLIQQGALPLLK